MWSYSIHETITGTRLMSFSDAIGQWGRTAPGGQGQHAFKINDADNEGITAAQWRRLAEPNATTLAVAWNGVPLWAGLILRATYARSGGTLTVQHVNIRTLLRERTTAGVGNHSDGDLTIANRNLSGVARAILQRGVFAWGPLWALPIDLPADGAGSENWQIRRWAFERIDDLLVRTEELGATIDFDPYYTGAGDLRWAVKIGTPHLPGANLEFVATAEDTPVTNLVWTSDGSKQLSGAFALGKGTEADMRVGLSSGFGGPVIPVRDGTKTAKNISDVSRLNQMAQQELVRRRNPEVSWSFDLFYDESWNPALLKPGARIRLSVWGDPIIPDGNHDLIVTGVGASNGLTFTPEVQPL